MPEFFPEKGTYSCPLLRFLKFMYIFSLVFALTQIVSFYLNSVTPSTSLLSAKADEELESTKQTRQSRLPCHFRMARRFQISLHGFWYVNEKIRAIETSSYRKIFSDFRGCLLSKRLKDVTSSFLQSNRLKSWLVPQMRSFPYLQLQKR